MPTNLPPLQFLVDVAWLQEQLRAVGPGASDRLCSNLLCLDARTAEDYARGHLPGAVNVDTYQWGWYDSSPAGVQAYTRKMASLAVDLGVRRHSPVLFYQGTSGMLAARGVWLLHYLGHRRVAMLDGGLRAWAAAGGEVVEGIVEPMAGEHPLLTDASCLASYEYVRHRLGDRHTVILDVRSEDEYVGRNVRASRGGTIPGAVNLEWTTSLDAKRKLLPLDQLRQLFESRGISPGKEVITFCQGGARSSHTYLVLRLLGYPRVRNFIGSWHEWADRHELPIETPQAKDRAPDAHAAR